jgi:NosR/NirI family transcriptional regulator, nitrous oxide reductase regulator
MTDSSAPLPNPDFQLPVITPPTRAEEPATPIPRRRGRAVLLHLLRIALFVTTLTMIRIHAQRQLENTAAEADPTVTLFDVWNFFPSASAISSDESGQNLQTVLNADGKPLGYVVQTSPESDSIVGFSGPTNILLAFDEDDRVVGAEILWSRDTREHVDMILADGRLLAAWKGLTWQELATHLSRPDTAQVDAVSGATLTSFAIAESVALRLTGSRPTSLRFPDELTVEEVQSFYDGQAKSLVTSDVAGISDVLDRTETRLGSVLRTSPAAENITGYQGPTDSLIALDPEGRVIGIRLRNSFDNEDPDNPSSDYVGYVRGDDYFLSLFNGKTLAELASLDLFEEQVEGVSGATMTSMAVAEGLVAAAQSAELDRAATKEDVLASSPPGQAIHVTWRTVASAVLVLFGVFPGLLRRGISRRVFQLVVIVLLGVVNGDLVSQAVLVGWTQNGIPWRLAPGLLVVVASALLVPMLSRQQPYCQHLCPHGAVQQLLIRRIRWQWKIPRRLHLALSAVPFILLVAVVVIPLRGLSISLVDLEPFDAWVIGLAGVAAAIIAVVGLVASLFVPMAYCRYGCPTGALLQFLRFHGRSDRVSAQDYAAALLAAVAVGFVLAG